jgi:hypothetical protein
VKKIAPIIALVLVCFTALALLHSILTTPTKSKGNLADCTLCDSKLIGEFALRDTSLRIDSSDVIDFSSGKFVHSVPFSRSGSALRSHVPLIVEHRPCEQMSGVDARRIIALVENLESCWKGSVMNDPRGNMGIEIVSSRCSAKDLTVSGFISASKPYPTPVSNIYFGPEPGQECSRKSL